MCIATAIVVTTIVCINYLFTGGSFFHKRELIGKDIELWKNTPAWKLAKAVQGGDTAKISRILERDGISVDYREPKFGETLLHWAVENNRIDMVSFLLKKGANPNLHCYYDGESPMILVSKYLDVDSNPEILRLLLKYGGNPNDYVTLNEYVTHERSTKTPLTAASSGSLSKVKLLLDAGADIEFTVKKGRTPLYHAALGNRFDVIKYLLDNGADYRKVYIVTMHGDTLRFLDLLGKYPYQNTKENEVLLRQIKEIVKASASNK